MRSLSQQHPNNPSGAQSDLHHQERQQLPRLNVRRLEESLPRPDTMAHQASRIPWSLLASSLGCLAVDDGEGLDLRIQEVADLRPHSETCFKQGSNLDKFVDGFLAALSKDSQAWSKNYSNPASRGTDDVVLNDDIVCRIIPTIQRVTPSLENCFGDTYKTCRGTIPHEQRKTSAFQRIAWTNGGREYL